MIIDHTFYAEFWRNPERARLHFIKNITPKKKPEYWTLGGLTHKAIELHHQGKKDIRSILEKEAAKDIAKPEDQKKMVDKALKFFEAFRMHRAGSSFKKIEAEVDIDFQARDVDGSPIKEHRFVGQLDEVLNRNNSIEIGEIKTANAKSKSGGDQWKWDNDTQIDMVLLGYFHKALEFALPSTKYKAVITTIQDTLPPKVFEILTYRTPARLRQMEFNLVMTAQFASYMIENYGIEHQWMHFASSYPCSFNICEYQPLCVSEREGSLSPIILKRDFKTREEHLEHVKGKRY